MSARVAAVSEHESETKLEEVLTFETPGELAAFNVGRALASRYEHALAVFTFVEGDPEGERELARWLRDGLTDADAALVAAIRAALGGA